MHPRLRHARAAYGLRDLIGETLTPEQLIARFARRGWRPVFFALARVAAICCNGDLHDRQLRRLQQALRTETEAAGGRLERRLASRLATDGAKIPVAHEAALYLLEALAVMHGSDDDASAISDAELAFLLLAANDYVFDWREPDERDLTRTERLVADSCRSLLFNHQGDTAAAMVRGALVLEGQPRRTRRWARLEEWQQLQIAAFGVSVAEYVEGFAGPLHLLSHTWESTEVAEGERRPVLNPQLIMDVAGLPADLVQAHLSRLTIERDAARESLTAEARADGIPVGTTLFQRHPFVRFDQEHLVAASPWAVREHLRAGLWARMRDAARDEKGRESKDWPSAFGDLVEQWCQRVARYAWADARSKGRLLIAPSPDDGEIEDLVVVQSSRVALISVKGSMIRGDLLRGARRRSNAVAFFERFFFDEKRGDYRAGAARLLQKKVDLLRAGAYEPDISRHALVYPIVVTYDDLGADSPGGYDYLSARCNAGQVLRGPRVRPLVCMGLGTFENLMGYCATGPSLFDMLDRKSRPPFDTARFDVLLEARTRTCRHRLVQIDGEFHELSQRIQARLAVGVRRSRDRGTIDLE